MHVMTTDHTKISLGIADKDHPIWGVLKPLTLTACVGGLLYAFASNFDSSEVKTIIFTLLSSFGLELVNVRKRGR